jgi:hypothetical protein
MRPCLFTIPIAELKDDPNRALIGLGSGSLVNSAGKKVFIGVSHVLKDSAASYAMHIRNDINQGAQFRLLNPTVVECVIALPERGIRLDFFVQALEGDVCPKEQPARASGTLLEEQDKLVFAFTDIVAPALEDTFGFCGLTRPVKASDYTDTTRVSELGLRFDRKEDTRLVFKLGHQHPATTATRAAVVRLSSTRMRNWSRLG